MAHAKDISITSIETASYFRRRILAAEDTILVGYEVKVKSNAKANDVKAQMQNGEFVDEFRSDLATATNVDAGKLKVVGKSPVMRSTKSQCIECMRNCSNHGTCDFSTGVCTCNTGYFGKGCERMLNVDCPNDCSGHGRCSQTLTDPSICHCSWIQWNRLFCRTLH